MQYLTWFWREARRRKVFRTAALYVVGAWVSLQVAALVFPGFGIPQEAIRALIWAAVLGFPVALVFGWLFEIDGGGIHRTASLGPDERAGPQPLARRDYALLAALAAIAALLAYQAAREVGDTASGSPALPMPDDVERLPNSIAVLPFVNISNDPDNDYFCDGISEEILNALGGVRELNVIGRTSSFAFKGSDEGIDRISAVLGVGHVLQGSVRKAGSKVRISAQLLDESGRQIWTQTFDRELADVFAIQSEIAAAVVAKVAPRVTARTETGPHPNLAAYEHYLAGRELLHRRDTDGALAELQRAIDIDPKFAEAHAEWAIARLMGSPARKLIEESRAAINRALALRPKLLRAQAAQAFLYLQGEAGPADVARAETILRGVIEQDPNMSDALNWLTNALSRQGRDEEALEVLERAWRIDPIHPSIARNLAQTLSERGRTDEAERVIQRHLQQPNPGLAPYWFLADHRRQQGQLIEMNAVSKAQALRVGADYYLLMLSYALLGDRQAAQYWAERSPIDLPESKWNSSIPVSLAGWRGRYEEALSSFRDARLADRPELASDEREIKLWYGALLAHTGAYAAAIEELEPLIEANGDLFSAQLVASPILDGQHSLAWSYLRTGANDKSGVLLSYQWRLCETELNPGIVVSSDVLHYCAETALLRGDTEQALRLLERAVDAGWRDFYLRQPDPYWASLEGDPRYRSLMARVKADIDRQRAEVRQIDARENFPAKLDAERAARQATATKAAGG